MGISLVVYAGHFDIPIGDTELPLNDLKFIERTLFIIAIGMVGFFFKETWSFIKNSKSTTEHDVKKIFDILVRVETQVAYLERTTVKREDIIGLIRNEIEYRERS